MQKGIRLNDGHVTYLGLLAKKDGTRRGCLSKKSSDNTKWHTKWFALLQNMLFYFENESSSRPSGLYLLEGCTCDRAPSPKPSLSAKECLEKQVRRACACDHAQTDTHAPSFSALLFCRLPALNTSEVQQYMHYFFFLFSDASELPKRFSYTFILHISHRMMTSNPVQQNSMRFAVLHVM